jgi:hypothetical protein
MPSGPVPNPPWATGTWEDTAWEAGAWGEAGPTPGVGSLVLTGYAASLGFTINLPDEE